MSYADAIARFAAALTDGADAAVPVTAATRGNLGYYRGNVQANRSSALQSAFATVHALVGEAYFAALAQAYQRAEPSTSGNLHDDGAHFARFIATFQPAQSLPFLADVARLDWAMHRAHFAADLPAADLAPLQNLAADQFGLVAFALHPAVDVVRSAHWPVHAIYAMHHGGPAASLDTGGEAVLVMRDAIEGIDHASAEFTLALQQQHNINNACEAAWQIAPDFDPGPVLGTLFGRGLITALHLPF
ncbi:HvfC/BufC N-terminal domain-containing protein [Silvimonas iriomotensis]|uniref:Putative DNA-binding domain-containing protein n=1 Tax=Silvimonas iriomotensis TaxID=449662 RepID=A0ABQ2P7W7_9NEIS|nr:DNA-binding domain-containing protein [Silvimonas iriomotensis]GGP20161.1 hypothetical protein GCM10010970_13850 [Silvimonas iriomotensis]